METVSSPRHHASRASRNSTTPSIRSPTQPGSVGQKSAPLIVPPRNAAAASSPSFPSHVPSIKTASPNYFDFHGSNENSFLSDSPHHSKQNWSPPSSAVRSTAAASPSLLPLDQNPDFHAFRQQSEGKAFNLGGLGNDFNMNTPSNPPRSRHGKSISRSDASKEVLYSHSLDPASAERRSPKRVLSPGSQTLPEESERGYSAGISKSESRAENAPMGFGSSSRVVLPLDKAHGPKGYPKPRPETASAAGPASTNEMESTVMLTPQGLVGLLECNAEERLLLDLRVSTQYTKSHIAGALNLCIPTTLLKRPSFNVQKLAETFKDEEQRRHFERWRDTSYIIVYDASSSTLKDAHTCVNTIKKFRSEGYEGTLYIVKGGLEEFSRRHPGHVTNTSDSWASTDASKDRVDNDGPEVAPVVGGCPMPSTAQPANPFFGNIRQNMDLIGGVGQIAIQHPSRATSNTEKDFPEWLRKVSTNKDQGSVAARRFERIEQREKKRMEDALSGHVSYGSPHKTTPSSTTQIAGIEKGTKNRYNNIWPFEQSRVKLHGVPRLGCDYFNGSHIKAAWSNKRYISTQAPVPGTFNDFWNVIWQQDVRVIVMLTAEQDGAQVKAHNYWDKKQYGPFRLDFLSEKRASIDPARIHRHRRRPSAVKRMSTGPQLPMTQLGKDEKGSDQSYVVVRRFTLSHEKQPFEALREVTQLQYSGWPDFGAPAHPAHLLGLVEQCDAVVRSANKTKPSGPEPPNKRPVLVHCSAGCGRTGTFCTVDSVIDMLKRQRLSQRERSATPMDIDDPPPKNNGTETSNSPGQNEGFFSPSSQDDSGGVEGGWVHRHDQDLIEKTVEDFRRQRMSMVQTLRQYILCYESVMEWMVEQALKDGLDG